MRSGTSFFDWTLFKKNVTRFWPIWGSYLAIWIIVMPFSYLMNMPDTGVSFLVSLKDVSTGFIFTSVAFGLIAAVAVLSHLMNPVSANFYGALPMRREGVCVTQYLSGLAFGIVPNIIVVFLTALEMLIAYEGGWPVIPQFLILLAVGSAEYFFFYSLAFFCGTLTGNILAMPIFYGSLNVATLAILSGVNSYVDLFYESFTTLPEFAEEVALWLTPALKFSNIQWFYTESITNGELIRQRGFPMWNWGILGIYTAVGLVLAALALVLYKKRSLERAGEVAAFPFVKVIFKYSVALASGFLLGYITGEILTYDALPFAVVFWGVAGCLAAQMLLDKSFRVFKKWRGPAVTGVVLAAVMAVMVFDLTGFDSWVPERDEVESVYINNLYSNASSGHIYGVEVTDPRLIDYIIDIHREAVESGGTVPRSTAQEYSTYVPDDYINIDLSYKTESGTRRRRFDFPINSSDKGREGTAAHALEALYSDSSFVLDYTGLTQIEEYLNTQGRIGSAEFIPSYIGDYVPTGYLIGVDSMTLSGDQIRMLYDAVKEDILNGDLGPGHVGENQVVIGSVDFYWGKRTVADGSWEHYAWLDVTASAKRTVSVLSKIAPESMRRYGFDYDGELHLPTPGTERLTSEKLLEICKKGENVTWADFAPYEYELVMPGVMIARYYLEDCEDDGIYVTVGGLDLTDDTKPMYACIVNYQGIAMDVRYGGVDTFLEKYAESKG